MKPQTYLSAIDYPGRGLLLGLTPDAAQAVIAYFIMGRSANSRNRIFVADGNGLRTEAFDPALVSDPSLIIYAPVRVLGKGTIVSNGDQTDTVFDTLQAGGDFAQALRKREFEPDAPNYTPRISGLLLRDQGRCSFKLSVLKRGESGGCLRFFYEYAEPAPGKGLLIHTYSGDGDPLPSFSGEPAELELPQDINELAGELWQGLNEDNKVSLFVRYLDLMSGEAEDRIINKNS